MSLHFRIPAVDEQRTRPVSGFSQLELVFLLFCYCGLGDGRGYLCHLPPDYLQKRWRKRARGIS